MRVREFLKAVRKMAKYSQICTRCLKKKAMRGRSRCKGCNISGNKNQRSRYVRDLKNKVCPRCHKRPSQVDKAGNITNRRCQPCEEYHQAHR